MVYKGGSANPVDILFNFLSLTVGGTIMGILIGLLAALALK